MGLPNLSGSNIQDTYQRVLQTDNGTLRDGTGSLVTFTSITSSNISLGANIVHTGDPDTSINFGVNSIRLQAGGELLYDAKSTGLDISKNITSSANISASGTIIASSSLFNNITITPEGSYGGILDITSGQFEKTTAKFINTFNSTNNNTFAGYFQGGNANGTPGGTEKSYGIYTLAGNTNQSNPDSIALYAQSHEDGSPNSYAAIFSGSGGVVGINTLEPTEALHVVGNISASGTITAASFVGNMDGGSF